jgi:hypothetical protein
MSCGTGAATCTVSGTTATIVTCAPTYYLLSGACVLCSATSTGAAATTPSGIAGCTACTVPSVGIEISAVYVVACTACAANYALISPTIPAGTSTITIATCLAYTTASGVTLTAISGNSYFTPTATWAPNT